jgi:hypothetical protein
MSVVPGMVEGPLSKNRSSPSMGRFCSAIPGYAKFLESGPSTTPSTLWKSESSLTLVYDRDVASRVSKTSVGFR